MGRSPARDMTDGLFAGPYEARLARGTHGRAALEIYVHGGLYDVTVADGLTRSLLRGAVRGAGWALAWGQFPGEPVRVSFTRRRVSRPARIRVFAERFWIAETDVRARGVVVTTASEAVTSRLASVRKKARS